TMNKLLIKETEKLTGVFSEMYEAFYNELTVERESRITKAHNYGKYQVEEVLKSQSFDNCVDDFWSWIGSKNEDYELLHNMQIYSNSKVEKFYGLKEKVTKDSKVLGKAIMEKTFHKLLEGVEFTVI